MGRRVIKAAGCKDAMRWLLRMLEVAVGITLAGLVLSWLQVNL